jgi:glycosyltransferase involved in cell wall biosynthesis
MSDVIVAVPASVIVVTLIRASELRTTPASLRVQRTDFRYEIIVVDNNSSDETKTVVATVAASDAPVRYVAAPVRGISFARDAGVAASRGIIQVFADDDIIAPPSWLAALVGTYAAHPDAWCVGGRILLELPVRDVPTWFDARLAFYLTSRDLGMGVVRRHYPQDVYAANFSVTREALRRVGLFNPSLRSRGDRKIAGDKTELIWRIQRAGGAVYYCGGATVAHRVPPSRLTKRFFRGQANWQGRAQGLLRVDDPTHGPQACIEGGARRPTWIKSRRASARFDRVSSSGNGCRLC